MVADCLNSVDLYDGVSTMETLLCADASRPKHAEQKGQRKRSLARCVQRACSLRAVDELVNRQDGIVEVGVTTHGIEMGVKIRHGPPQKTACVEGHRERYFRKTRCGSALAPRSGHGKLVNLYVQAQLYHGSTSLSRLRAPRPISVRGSPLHRLSCERWSPSAPYLGEAEIRRMHFASPQGCRCAWSSRATQPPALRLGCALC